MKKFIPHNILVINEGVFEDTNKQNLIKYLQLAFDWANQMGLKGKHVYNVHKVSPDISKNPMVDPPSFLRCFIECTDEEREKWDKDREINVRHAISEFLKD